MLRVKIRYLLGIMALILGSGITVTGLAAPSPISQTEQVAQSKTYRLSELEGPYVTFMNRSKLERRYLFTNWRQPLNATQIADDQVWASIEAEMADAKLSQGDLLDILDEEYTASQGDSLIQFIFKYTSADNEEVAAFDPENFRQFMIYQTYVNIWMLSRTTRYQEKNLAFTDLTADYDANLRPLMKKMYLLAPGQNEASVEDFLSTFDMFMHDETFFQKYVVSQMLAPLQAQYGVTHDSPELVGQLDPTASMTEMAKVFDAPLTQYATKLTDGTYRLSGQVLTLLAMAIPGEEPTDPEIPVTPDGEQGQPVTVRYLDERGRAIAPSVQLTGKLGSSYRTTAKAITGYQLDRTTGVTSGVFTTTPQTVSYHYLTLNAGGDGDTVAAKGTVVTATKKVGLYRSTMFTTKKRQQWYVRKPRTQRPMFVVMGYDRSAKGTLRYRVRDVNHRSPTKQQTGYLTANADYVTKTYYQNRPTTVTVINPAGVNAYRHARLTGKQQHYRQGQVLRVKGLVNHRLTTRFKLTNGTYVTANKDLVQRGRVKHPQQVRAKGALNRYTTPNLTKRNRHYPAKQRATFEVVGWTYSNANDFTKGSRLRYRVAGGYITANRQFVKPMR